jgi:hypothetical protein
LLTQSKKPGGKKSAVAAGAKAGQPAPPPKPISPTFKELKAIASHIEQNPGDRDGILTLCDRFLADFSTTLGTLDAKEMKTLDFVMSKYVPFDESRLQRERRKLRDAHTQRIYETRREEEERVNAAKRKEELEKREIEMAEYRTKMAKEREERDKQRAIEYLRSVYIRKNSLRRFYIDLTARKRYAEAIDRLKVAVNEPFNPDVGDFKDQAEEFSSWGTRMTDVVESTRFLEDKIRNAGESLKGVQLSSVRDPQGRSRGGKILKIENGLVHFKPFLDEPEFAFPFEDVPEGEFASKIAKRTADSLDRGDATFKYLLGKAMFPLAIKYAPDETWKEEIHRTAREYIYFKLRDGTPEEKQAVRTNFGRIEEFRIALDMLEKGVKSEDLDMGLEAQGESSETTESTPAGSGSAPTAPVPDFEIE